MSTLQDTDLILVNRGGTDYKITFADWKNSQGIAPDIGTVVLADSPQAGRFTSATFASTVTMTENGIPVSSKGLKAWVEGNLQTTAKSDEITAVDTFPLPNWVGFGGSSPITDPGSAFDGSTTTHAKFPTPLSTGDGSSTNYTTITFSPPLTGVTSLRVHTFSSTIPANVAWVNGNKADRYGPWDDTGGPFWHDITPALAGGTTVMTLSLSGCADTIAAAGSFWLYAVEVNGVVLSTGQISLTFKTNKDLASFAAGDAITQEDNAATGTVGSVNVTAKTMALATSTGTWGPANAGHHVVGPTKSGSSVRLYTVHDAAGNVSDLQSADPGYVTMTGNSPYTLTFPATLPSGNPPDSDLPAGTKITTEVQATNASGSDSATSNTVTPA